jgi:hypothetical protein
MSKITWNARMYFESDDKKVKIDELPILSFQVRGGATRTVHLNSAESTDVAFELDDARDFKNLHIFIAPTEGIAVAQLGEAFMFTKRLDAIFVIESRIGKTLTKAFVLRSEKAIITRQPVTVQRKEERTLKIEMVLPDPSLREMSYNGKGGRLKDI